MPKAKKDDQILSFGQCRHCAKELPVGQSPREFARFEFGWTKKGLQIRCVRHNCNVIHIDFEGHKHPAVISDDGT